MPSLHQLRIHAISHSLFPPTTLEDAFRRMGFVQADPIRSPARAQDLILRHRVKDYRAGDLDRAYGSLEIEEDYLYAYGFVSRDVWQLLHPRAASRLSKLDQKVLNLVRSVGPMHPRHSRASLGSTRVINAWGGYSKATKCALERLHYGGFLRIARREKGIRVYEALPTGAGSLSPKDRLKRLLMVTAKLLAPVSERLLMATASRLRRPISRAPDHRRTIRELISSGDLEKQVVDGISYLWPPSSVAHEDPPRRVRFLAPFDPLVWDRQRFEHLWGWAYRFEAYTPSAKRVRGYYAMPLLWCAQVIGWANVGIDAQNFDRNIGRKLTIEFGYVGKPPASREFKREVEAEIERLRGFLDLKSAVGS